MPQAVWSSSRPGTKEKLEQVPRCSSSRDAIMEARVTRSQAKIREKCSPFSNGTTMKEPRNSSNATGVGLLTSSRAKANPRTASQGVRQTSLLAIEPVRSSAMDIDVVPAEESNVVAPHRVLAAAQIVLKEADSFATAVENRTGTGASAKRLSSIGWTGPEPMAILKSGVGGAKGRQVSSAVETEECESRIMVYVRLRPLSKKEKESGARSCVKIDNKRDVYVTELGLETDYLRLKRMRGRHFAFDAAFPDTTPQEEVYNASAARLVKSVLDGRNASVFCYGATGAGKTYTMLGTVQHPGVMVLALKDLFAKLKLRSPEGEHAVRLSYLEVYNESVRDLLAPGRPLVLREDTKLGTVATGLTQYRASSADEIMALLHKGNTNRQTEPTRANETSSRSHAILQVVVEYNVQQESTKGVRVGKLSLIDLAGSERALATDQRTVRSVEGANINRSLLALSSCINALVEGKKHIPFRNSKLTQLLKDSLGGPCQTAMIANVSPSNGAFGETQNTLHWADRAKEIRTKVQQGSCEVVATEEPLQMPEPNDEQVKLLLKLQNENQLLKLHLARLEQRYLSGSGGTAVEAATQSSPPPRRTYPDESPLPAIDTLAKRAEAKTLAEKKIWELQRTVELLEMEAEKTRRDSALREEKLNAAILALTRDHTMQLKQKDECIRDQTLQLTQKDEYIRDLTYKIEAAVDVVVPSPKVAESPIKCLEKILKERADSGRKGGSSTAEGMKERPRQYITPEIARKALPPPAPTSSRPALARSKPEAKTPPRPTSQRMTPRTQTISSPAKTPTRMSLYSKGLSPSKADDVNGRKRTFWDITNSPNRLLGRSPRSSTGGSSQLRQPGFARRRTSPEQD